MVKPEDKTILVVDDEPDVIIFLQTALEDAGFNVVTANDGQEALERIKEKKPDFISLDLVMPRKSGIRLVHELRRNKEWSKIPFIIVTGHARDKEYREGLNGIMADKTLQGEQIYLEKPVKAHAFVAMVCNKLGIEIETTGLPGPAALDSMKSEVDQLMKDSDPETLKQILSLLKKKGQ